MREWNLKAGSPLCLTLAADARLTPVDYVNDQIWELSISGGEPPALTVQTTYGLRASSVKIFPRFIEGEQAASDPAAFAVPVSVRHFYPSFIEVNFAPFKDLQVQAEYWAAGSQVLAGRFRLANSAAKRRSLKLELAAVLVPCGPGQRMAPAEMELAPALSGACDGLSPVLFLSGGPQAITGSYPSLALEVELEAGGRRLVSWAIAAKDTPQESFSLARQTAARNWDAERARLDLVNSNQLEIHCGDPDWDAAFAFAQKSAFGMLLNPGEALPKASFVSLRTPDQGFSRAGTGRDYTQFWNGQSAMDSYYLAGQLLPADPQAVQGLVENFLSTQRADGTVDWKPGLGGQSSQLQATPLLASLAWTASQEGQDKAFIERVYPGLLRFVQAWFAPRWDQDADGVPEWSNLVQTGYEDNPLFAAWLPNGQGADIATAESPALCAFLYREIEALIEMARLLGQEGQIPELEARRETLRTAVEAAWDSKTAAYLYWDRDAHFCTPGEELGSLEGPGTISLQQDFDQPARLLATIQTSQEATRRAQVFVHGTSPGGQHLVERIPAERFGWFMGTGRATGARVYSRIDEIELQGIDASDRVTLRSVSYAGDDLTLLLPLWAGIPAPERVKLLVKRSLQGAKRYGQPYGLPMSARKPAKGSEAAALEVSLPWNTLIGEGLESYGYRKEAAELVKRLMKAVVHNLKQEGGFYRHYHAQSGAGLGEKDALEGLAPMKLFLETLGVRIISSRRVALSGTNPYPWPVTIKYRGLTVFRRADKTTVIFPGGQTVNVNKHDPQVVSLE